MFPSIVHRATNCTVGSARELTFRKKLPQGKYHFQNRVKNKRIRKALRPTQKATLHSYHLVEEVARQTDPLAPVRDVPHVGICQASFQLRYRVARPHVRQFHNLLPLDVDEEEDAPVLRTMSHVSHVHEDLVVVPHARAR